MVRSLVLLTAIAAAAFILALGVSAVGLLALENTVTSEAELLPLVLLWVGGVVLMVAALAVVAVTWLGRRPRRPSAAPGDFWSGLQRRYGGALRLANYRPVGLEGARYRGLSLEVVRLDSVSDARSGAVRLEGGGNIGSDWELVLEGDGLVVKAADPAWADRLAGSGILRLWQPFAPGLRRLAYSAAGAVLTYEGSLAEGIEQFEELLSAMAQTLTAVAYTAGRPVG